MDVVSPARGFMATAPGAEEVFLRAFEDRAVVWDDLARLGVVDLSTGQLLTSVSLNI